MAANVIEVVAVGEDQVSPVFDELAKETTKSTKRMAAAIKKLGKSISTNLKTPTKEAAKQMSDLGKSLALKLTVPIIAFGAAAVQQATSFQAAMNFVGAVTKSTGKELELLRDTAKDLGRTTQFSASQAAEAMKFLGLAGLKTNEIIGVMPKTLELAASAQLDLGTAANIVTGIVKGFSFEFSELAKVNDVLVNAFTSTKTDLASLGQGLAKVGSTAKQLGFEFKEVTAALGLLAEKEFGGVLGGTALRRILASLISLTPKAAKAFKKYGIEVKNADGSLKSIVKIVKEFEKVMKKGASQTEITQIAFEAFGQRGGPAFLALISQGSQKLEELIVTLHETGTASRTAEAAMKGLPGVFLRLKSVFEALNLAIIESGLDAFLIKIITLFSDLLESMAKTNPIILAFSTIIAGIIAIIPLLLIGLAAFKTALITLGVIGSGPAVVALIALTAGMVLFGSSSSEASDLIDRSSIKVLKNLSDMGDGLRDSAKAAEFGFKSMADFSKNIEELGITSIKNFTKAVHNNLLVFDKALNIWERSATFIGTRMTPIMREIISIFGRPAAEFLKLGEKQMLNIIKVTDSFNTSLRTLNISFDEFNQLSRVMQISFLRSIGLFPQVGEGIDDISQATENLKKAIISLERKARDIGKSQIELLIQQKNEFVTRAKVQKASVNEMIRIEKAFATLIIHLLQQEEVAIKSKNKVGVDSFKESLKTMLEIGKRTAENLSSAFSSLFFDFFDDKIDDMSEAWEKFGDNIKNVFLQAISDIVTSSLVKELAGIVGSISEGLSGTVDGKGVGGVLGGVIKGTADGGETLGGSLGGILKTGLSDIGTNITGSLKSLLGKAGPIGAIIAAAIAIIRTDIIQKLIGGVVSIFEDIPKTLAKIGEFVPSILKAFTDGVINIVKTIPAIIQELLESSLLQLLNLVEGGIDNAINILDALPDIVENLVTILPNIITKMSGIIVSIIQKLPVLLTKSVTLLPKILGTLVFTLPQTMRESLSELPKVMREELKKLPGTLKDSLKEETSKVARGGSGFSDVFDPFDIFHTGGVIKAHRGLNLSNDEIPLIAQTGEGILSRTGMSTLGGSNLDSLNQGQGVGSSVVIQNVEMFPNVTEGDILFNLPDTTLERWVRNKLFVTFDSLSQRGIVPEFAQ